MEKKFFNHIMQNKVKDYKIKIMMMGMKMKILGFFKIFMNNLKILKMMQMMINDLFLLNSLLYRKY